MDTLWTLLKGRKLCIYESIEKNGSALCAVNDRWVRELMDYIDKNSNLSVEWIDREHFVEPSMCGFRLVKKKDVN